MKQIILIVCICVSLTASAQIDFKTEEFSKLVRQAKKEKKLILLDAYTTWCKPCKWMEEKVFSNDTVGRFYNDNFICVRMDMEGEEGKLIAKEFEILCYPSFLFIDGNRNVVHRTSGAYYKDEFISVGITALDTSKRFGRFDSKYKQGKLLASEFVQYIEMIKRGCIRSVPIIAEYETTFTEQDLSSRGAWLLLNTVIERKSSRLFQYMLTNRSVFDVLYTPDSVDRIIENIYFEELIQGIGFDIPDTAKYLAMRDTIQRLNMPIADKIVMKGDVHFYWYTGQGNKFVTTVLTYMERYGSAVSYLDANNYAFTVYEYSTDKNHLKMALQWTQQSISQSPQWFNTDTYACILYGLGRYKEAHTWATISIQLAKDSKANYSETEKLLDKIRIALN